MLLHQRQIPWVCWEGGITQLALGNSTTQVREVIQLWGPEGFIISLSPSGFSLSQADSQTELFAILANLI